ncbi:MAG: helix-turn-helix domain-containing protein [Acidobacteria bacterium]|nr:helix-turn-helix domain-containing protein [Acidobacteriota bacterium]
MKCDRCGGVLIARRTTRRSPYHYRISGLDNVFLVGITVYSCAKCGSRSPVIPRIMELQGLIAQELTRKRSRLSGRELRFLRTNAGFPARQFASLLGVSPEHLSRIENGKIRQLGTTADKLARFISATKADRENVHQELMKMADSLRSKRSIPKSRNPTFLIGEEGHWRSAA